MSLTAMVVTGVVVVLGIYDLIAVTFGGVGTSISRFMQRSSIKHPFVAFAMGFVCGHIFGYMAPEPVPVDESAQTESDR